MAKGVNMKVNMTADNSDLVRKSKESKQSLKDFEKVGDDALSKLGDAFGVNTGKIEQMSSALRGLGTKMAESGNAGTAAFGKLLTSIGGVSTAIAGLGIGAAVSMFKMLNDEAENFKSTVAGANIEMATAAYIDAYRQVIHDFNREVGQGAAEAQSSWKKFWGTLGAGMRASFQTGAAASAGMVGDFNNQALITYNDLLTEAAQKARTAEEISNEMYETTRQISDKTVEWARMEREIAEYKRIAYDKSASTTQQQEALAKATELIKQKFGEQAELQGKLADLQAEYNSLAESSVADIDKANQLRVQAENVTAAMNNALRELSERQATVTANAQKEAEARQAALAAAQAMAASRKTIIDWRSEAGAADAGSEMLRLFNGNVDLLSRPLIDAAELIKKGWEDAGEGIATVFSSQYGITDASGKTVEILVTPILPDGSVMTPQELEDYIYGQLENAENILAADNLGIVIATDVAADSGEILHKLQEIYYDIDGEVPEIKLPVLLDAPDAGIVVPVKPELDTDSIVDITNELQSVLTSSFESIGTSLGSLIGDLATGGDAWSNFTNSAISAFGDMAIAIGKMAISTGAATLGIKAALETLNPYVAIAAGTALVALGMAVKSGLSNIASGGYSSSTAVATSGNYGSSTNVGMAFDQRELNIKVSGNLYASGNQLMAVIENENNRINHTT